MYFIAYRGISINASRKFLVRTSLSNDFDDEIPSTTRFALNDASG